MVFLLPLLVSHRKGFDNKTLNLPKIFPVKNIINWIANHDNKTLFIVLYIGLSVVLSIVISLFWLLFVVLIHFAFELITQSRMRPGGRSMLLESLWETKLDFALVIFALWLAVYLDFIFGIAGLGAAARGGAIAASRTGSQAANIGGKVAQVSARFAALQRIIRGILLSLDDVANAAKSFFQRKKSLPADDGEEACKVMENQDVQGSSWTGKWTGVDYAGVILFLLSFALILLAPFITGLTWAEIGSVITEEFHPFPR